MLLINVDRVNIKITMIIMFLCIIAIIIAYILKQALSLTHDAFFLSVKLHDYNDVNMFTYSFMDFLVN